MAAAAETASASATASADGADVPHAPSPPQQRPRTDTAEERIARKALANDTKALARTELPPWVVRVLALPGGREVARPTQEERARRGFVGRNHVFQDKERVIVRYFVAGGDGDGDGTATCEGLVHFSSLGEGLAGSVHGGCLASVMDDAIVVRCFELEMQSPYDIFVTAYLNVSYRVRVPLGSTQRVTVTTERIEKNGSKLFVRAVLRDGDDGSTVLCTADSLMIRKADAAHTAVAPATAQ